MGREIHRPLLKIRRDCDWRLLGNRAARGVSVLRNQFGDEMIERITSYFDWVYDMPIESQCHFAIGLSLFGFVVAAAVRETVKHSGVRCLARAIGAGSFFAVAAFANHVSHEYEKLNFEVMVKKQQKASEIAKERVVAVTSSNGNKIEFGVSKHGVRVRTTGGGYGNGRSAGSECSEGDRRGKFAAVELGCDGGSNATHDGFNAAPELSKWWRHVWHGTDDGTAISFRAAGTIEGESF